MLLAGSTLLLGIKHCSRQSTTYSCVSSCYTSRKCPITCSLSSALLCLAFPVMRQGLATLTQPCQSCIMISPYKLISWKFISPNVVDAISRRRNAPSRMKKSWEYKSSCKRNLRNLQRVLPYIYLEG
ncbi:hypothetical protein CI102_8862 [Trichoderma harzianum]|nr:hypothetical protein CI102_8862 [Trichoderma harzianum]